MSIVLFIILSLTGLFLLQNLIFQPIYLLHWPHFPFWFNLIVGLLVLSWFMGDD